MGQFRDITDIKMIWSNVCKIKNAGIVSMLMFFWWT